MFLDIGGHDPLLPGGQAPFGGGFGAPSSSVEAHEFVDQDHAEGFGIEPVSTFRSVDCLPELRCGAPDRRVLEEQPRRKQHVGEVFLGIDLQLRGIEVEIRHARKGARFMPFMIFVARRRNREFLGNVAQRRARDALDIGFSVAAYAMFVCGKQVQGRAETIVRAMVRRCLHELDAHAGPLDPAAPDGVIRGDVHRW